jgi:hypothetical protein
MSVWSSANLIQAELIRRYHSRQFARRSWLSLEDAAREWISRRARMFRLYYVRRRSYETV